MCRRRLVLRLLLICFMLGPEVASAPQIQLPRLTVDLLPSGEVKSVVGIADDGSSRQLFAAGTTANTSRHTLMVAYFADAGQFPPYGAAVGTSSVRITRKNQTSSGLVATFNAPDSRPVTVTANFTFSGQHAMLAVTGLRTASTVPIRQIDLLVIPVRGLVRCAPGLAGAFDDTYGLFVSMADLEMDVLAEGLGDVAGQRCGLAGTVLRARARPTNAGGGGRWWNRSAVLWAGGGGAQLATAVQQVERQVGLPSPTFEDRWAKESPEARKGYWLVDAQAVAATNRSLRRMIALANASGVPYLALSNWAQTAGHYEPAAALGGLAGLKNLADKLRASGLSVGLHTMSANIACTPKLGCDRYVSPVPDPRLAVSPSTFILAEPLTDSASQSITVNGSTASAPASGTLRIGHELITYSGRTTEAPFVLTGVTRGVHNTSASAHQEGAQVYRLLPSFMGFLPQPDLMDEIVGNIVNVFKAVGAQLLYFDGAEAMPGTYGESTLCRSFAEQLKGEDCIFQASSGSSYCWHLISRRGQTDWGAIAIRAYWDDVKAAWVKDCKDNLMTPDVGWAGILDYSPGSWLPTTPQQMEFFASKAVAFGGALSLEMAGGVDGSLSGVTTNGRALEAAHKMGGWLKNRLNLPPETLALLRRPGLDHELTQENGEWYITPVKVHEPFVANPRIPESLSVSLPATFTTRKYSLRVRAKTPVASLGNPANIILASAATADHVTVTCPRYFTAKPGQIKTLIPNGTLTIQVVPAPIGKATEVPAKSLRLNFAAPTRSGIGCATFAFSARLNLTSHRPLGLLVHGDASNALMDLQLQDARGLIHDFFVRIDFAGWRTIRLDSYETSGLFEHLFPRTAFPDDLRGFETGDVVALNVYLTNATRADVLVRSIECLQEDVLASPTRDARVTVDGATIHVPDGLNAAVCAPGSNYSHNGPNRGCADYAECDLTTTICRSFDADNVELHLTQSGASLHPSVPTPPSDGRQISVEFSATSVARAEITVFEKGPRLGPFPTQ
jgi:hypothetical protein